MLERIREIIGERRRIAFYPGGGYTAYVLDLLMEAFPNSIFDLSLFDGNPALWGTKTAGYEVRCPDEIPTVDPEVIVVSNYNYSEEIYRELVGRFGKAVPVRKLHEPQDVPWVL